MSRAPLLWAILAAFGAALFVGAVVTVLFSLLYRLLSVPSDAWLPRPFQLSAIATIATALAVAWVSGGRHAVAAWAAIMLFERFVSLWGLGTFCGTISPAPPLCSPIGYGSEFASLADGRQVRKVLADHGMKSESSATPLLASERVSRIFESGR